LSTPWNWHFEYREVAIDHRVVFHN